MSNFIPLRKPIRKQTPCEIDTQLAALHELMYRHLVDYRYLEADVERARNDAQRERAEQARVASFERRTELLGQMAVFNREFDRRGGWTRYFKTHGRDGHVHREQTCSTCTSKTQFGWLPELSGCDENAMVEQQGDWACAVCFPGVLTHPAYIAGQAARAAHEQAQRQRECTGSETHVGDAKLSPNGRFAACPVCSRYIALRADRTFRRHRPT